MSDEEWVDKMKRHATTGVAVAGAGGCAVMGVVASATGGLGGAVEAVAKLGFPTAMALFGVLWFFGSYLPRQEAREAARYDHLRLVHESATATQERAAERTVEAFQDAVEKIMSGVSDLRRGVDDLRHEVVGLKERMDRTDPVRKIHG